MAEEAAGRGFFPPPWPFLRIHAGVDRWVDTGLGDVFSASGAATAFLRLVKVFTHPLLLPTPLPLLPQDRFR